ncbi:MAG: TolB protein [Zetaproteobacteria bacterium]|nr:MAG: TolB protein [Zetaproteobacteria bacterium]
MTAALLSILPGSAAAGSLLDWMTAGAERMRPGGHGAAAGVDNAELLTLEPGENEIYPRSGGRGEFFVTVLRRDRVTLERRALENGDPLNEVTEDPVPDSVQWRDGALLFLSTQVGGLGLWRKPADGMGLSMRIHQFAGRVEQPLLLADGSVIAVRLAAPARIGGERLRRRHGRPDPFDNWSRQGARAYIVRIAPDGTERRLADGINPALSPDGTWVAFSMAVGRSRHLFLMRTDGGALTQLSSGRAVDVQPAWSPDGRWIVFTSNRGRADMRHPSRSNWDLWMIRRDGRSIFRLTRDPARDGAPVFTPDGGAVLFHSDRRIGKQERMRHGVRHIRRGFHVWRIALPAELLATPDDRGEGRRFSDAPRRGRARSTSVR